MMAIKLIKKYIWLLLIIVSCTAKDESSTLNFSSNSNPTSRFQLILDNYLIAENSRGGEDFDSKNFIILSGFELNESSDTLELMITNTFNDSLNIDNTYAAEFKFKGYSVLCYTKTKKNAFLEVDSTRLWNKKIYPTSDKMHSEFNPVTWYLYFDKNNNLIRMHPGDKFQQMKGILESK